ncbi:MAG: efflux RND transporter permease subunit, partial [Pirellulaceae bacterium]
MSLWLYRNPRIIVLLIGLIAVAGLSSAVVLPRLEDPELRSRAANVYTRFPGANAERVEALVTEKLEDSLREVAEIKRVRSTSRAGMSLLAIELRDDVIETDPIWSRIRDKINDARPYLPRECQDPEFDQLSIKAYATLVAVVWRSPTEVSYGVLRREAKQLEEAIKALPGTEKVDRFGDPGETIHVNLDPARLAGIGLSVPQVADQIAASDAKGSSGTVRSTDSSVLLQIDEELDTLERLAATPIRLADEGHVVTLGDLATIEKGIQDPAPSLAHIDGQPAIILAVMSRSDYRIDHWYGTVDQVLEQNRTELGSGLSIDVLYHQDSYVTHRIASVFGNLAQGGLAVFVVILVMMGLRSALIVCAALPLASLMVIAGLRWLDIPIHQMSITGLIIALGLLIDNAIIMVDSVSHRLREGSSHTEAIRESLRHLALPLTGSTITTALAFAPIALMPGPAGEFVGSIAISVMLAIFSSLLLALSMIPAITALLSRRSERGSSRGGATGARSWWSQGISLPRLASLFESMLRLAIGRPWIGVVGGLGIPVLGFIAAGQLPEQFFPPADRDQIAIELELPSVSSIDRTYEMTHVLRERLLKEDRIQAVHWFVGESAPAFYYNIIPRRKATPNYAHALVQLDSPHEVRGLIQRLQLEINEEYPEARILVRQLEQGPPFDAPVEVRLFGPDLDTLEIVGEDVRRILADIPDVIHTASDSSQVQPQFALRVDEERARELGLNHRDLATQLRSNLDGATGGSIIESTEEIPVSVRAIDERRSDLAELRGLDFVAANRSPRDEAGAGFSGIPLTSLTDASLTSEMAAVTRYDGRRLNEIKAYITAGVLPATVLHEFERRLAESDFVLPPGYTLSFGGEAAERDQAISNLMANVGVLGVLMVVSLVLSFRSLRSAALVGIVGAMSFGLGLGALWLFGFPFGFMAIVGSMGLIGVAINDAIVVLAGLEEDAQASRGDSEAM